MYLGLAYIPVELFSILGICLKVVDNLLAKINQQLSHPYMTTGKTSLD